LQHTLEVTLDPSEIVLNIEIAFAIFQMDRVRSFDVKLFLGDFRLTSLLSFSNNVDGSHLTGRRIWL
jgi:hypothetical protein